jgi:hypothetical protein
VIESRRRWAAIVAYMGVDNGIEKCLVGKPVRKRRLEKSRRRWVT